MKLTRSFGLGIAALFAVVSAANADGFFSKWPVVSGAAYCALFAGDGTTCVGNVPAGPTALTGNERIALDTKLPSGQSPQSVLASPASLGAGPTQYSVPVTTNSITILPTTRQVIVNPAGTIAALTIVTPAAAAMVDNQRIGFCTTQIITTLTVTAGTGVTVSNAPTAMLVPVTTGAASCIEWMYVASQSTLFRVQ
jgi:hypothetical protein